MSNDRGVCEGDLAYDVYIGLNVTGAAARWLAFLTQPGSAFGKRLRQTLCRFFAGLAEWLPGVARLPKCQNVGLVHTTAGHPGRGLGPEPGRKGWTR